MSTRLPYEPDDDEQDYVPRGRPFVPDPDAGRREAIARMLPDWRQEGRAEVDNARPVGAATNEQIQAIAAECRRKLAAGKR